MSKFLLSGDWQTEVKNLDKCEAVLHVETKLIEKYKPLAIFDGGDLKDAYNPVDTRVLEFQVKRLTSQIEYVAVLGNHDRVGQYDDTRNWFSILIAAGIKAYVKPSIIHRDDVMFAILPYCHDKEQLLKNALWLSRKAQLDTSKRKVLIFHCSIKGAVFNASGIEELKGIELTELHTDVYDWCFGSHVHRRQMLAPNALYIGSPFAHDWGEANQSKGFMLYDSDANSIRFIPADIPGYYTYAWLKTHPKHKVEPNSKVKVIVNVSLKQDYYKKIERKVNEVAALYKNVEVFPVPKFTETETHNDVIVEIDSSDFEKLTKYVDATLPERFHKQKKKIVTYLATRLAAVEGKSIRADGRLEFISVVAHNVLSYEKLKFKYQNRGVSLVKGDNLDWPNHSNGAGKTSLLSMLAIALFGETFKKQKNKEWAREQVENPGRVVLSLKDEQQRDIKIIRQSRPTQLKLFINGKDESTGRRHKGKRETQGLIEEAVGFSMQTLANAVYIDSKISNSFLTGTQKERIELISRFQNIERFVAAAKSVAVDITTNKKATEDLESELELERKYVLECNQTIREHKEFQRSKVAKLRRAYKKALVNAKQLNRKGKRLFVKLTKRKINLHDNFCKRDDKILLFDQKLYALNVKIDETGNEISLARRKMQQTICPLCKRPMKIEDRSDAIKFLMKEQERLRLDKTQWIRERDELKDRNTSVYNRLKAVKDKLALTRVAIDAIWADVSKRKELLADYKKNSESALSLPSIRRKRDKAKKKIEALKKVIRTTFVDADELEYCLHAFSRDGLPLFINNLTIPVLNKAAEEYSKLFTDGEVQVRFDLDEGLFVPNVINLHGSKSIKGQSDGETAWAGIITSLALRELAPKTNVLAIDEPGHGLDPESAKQLGIGLRKLASRFETVLITTHVAALAAELEGDNTITIYKKNQTSYIGK